MAKKNESTNEKIIRLFKEGISIEDIAKETTLGVDIVTGIIEKRIPDFRNYDPSQDNKNETKSGTRSLSRLFGSKKKVNTNMGKDGFVSEQTNAIVEMLQREKTPEEISEFMNISVDDVKRVEDLKEEHLKRKSLSEENNDDSTEKAPETENNIKKESNENKETKQMKSDKKDLIKENGINNTNMIIESRPASLSIIKTSAAQNKINEFIQIQIQENETLVKEYDEEIAKEQEAINSTKLQKNRIDEEISKLKKQIAALEADLEGINNKYNNARQNIEQLEAERKEALDEIADYKKMIQ